MSEPSDKTLVLAERATLDRLAERWIGDMLMTDDLRAIRWALATIDRQAEQLKDCNRELKMLRQRRAWMLAKAREMLDEEAKGGQP